MREEGDLVIRAIRDDKVFELIPHHNFEGDLPLRFVQDYYTCIDYLMAKSSCVLSRACGNETSTVTFEMVQATLKPLERKEYLTVTCSNDFNPSSLAVDLPRYRLAFHRNDKDELESRNFPGMIVDHDDQSFGALVGLQNRLVLRPNNRSLAGARRKVLVPYGNVEISPYLDDHVTVTIDNKDDRIIRFADYVVDVEQGCLTGNTSLRSRLFLIYLLAVTSHCLPDPLTKVTGVEEALSEFHTAACMSSRELTEEDMDLLVKIGKLTPSRFGVPPSCPKVQSITWHPSLPPLSQHDAFIVRAKEIIASAEHQRVFDDEAKPQSEQNMKGKDKKDGLPARNHHVDSRAAARNAVYYPSDFAGAPQRRTYDLSYSSRDTQLLLETVVCSAASNVFLGPTYCLADKPRPLHHLFKRWARLRQPSKSFRLSYNRGWFSLNFADSWLSIYEKCIKSGSRDRKKYRLLFSLSAMVFANPQHSCFVAPIVFSFWDQTLRQQHVPHSVEFLFDLDQGIAPTDLKLASLITPAALPAEATPSWNLERLADEEDRDYDIRRRQHYHRRCKDFSVLLNNFFLGQWGDFMTHRLDITFNPNVSRSYYRVESLIANVQNYFNICNQNRLLINHARAVNSVFDTYFANTISYDVPEYDFQPCKDNVPSSSSSISLTGLLSRNAPALPQRDAQLWGNPDDFRNGTHPLSQLSSRSYSTRYRSVAESLAKSQRWLDIALSDVLDESDEILHIRYQLVYTVGQQQPLELHPDRWTIMEELYNGRLSSFNVRFLPETVQVLARAFVENPKVELEVVEELKEYCGRGNDWKHLLLLRGLIAHGILLYSLKARQYRVDYGLDLSRSLLAVPYRAKDVPSIRAEFGHPDVALALTCLTYYYQGLDSAQLKICFDLLFKLDNPPLEYESWVDDDEAIPIHSSDAEWLVFPKAAKEFPFKLSTSSWDLAEAKPRHLTTGFSGTNDNRFLLPTSISQRDPLQQSGTNAKVLTYLLQKENNHYHCAALPDGGRLPVVQFLEFMSQKTANQVVQVLLDVGAQMLDLKNEELAKEWLRLRPEMLACIFFSEKDELMVVTQDGTVETLISSPFKGQLDHCLVYLDDAHTRGTDLKLPINSRAAVTLGPKVTKDRLIQGAMRMRKLGYGQLRATPASHPIHVEDILRWTIFETCRDIQHHLPHWAEQGLDYLRRRQAWEEFSNEIVAADESEEEEITPNIDILQKVWVREEARTLEKMYDVRTGPGTTGVGGGDANLRQGVFSVPELRERLKSLGVNEVADVDVDEEQEREVNHEIEQETEIERPLKVEPAKHHLSHGLPIFVETGVLPFNGTGPEYRKGFQAVYESIENVLRRVPLIGVEGKAVWSPGLYATKDFSTTISERDVVERGSADYLRPVAFLLTSNKYEPNGVVVILSPFEVHHLLPAIRRSKHVHLHVYSPRVTKDMLPLDDLRFYVVPQLPAEPWNPPRVNIISQLNLFAGQLYLGNYDVYLSLCRFLGLHNGEEEPMEIDDEPYPVQSDGFVRVGPHRESMGLKDCRFNESPVPFLQELIGLRRKGMGYLPTHLGRIVHGRLLTADDFDY
ncbi:hypothetical protein D9758_009371 [Tetrapyrgos nigripes]|uniref:ubiquitinyl hydrolase 1 n=1 Tax=Tetrapyrgos nigripes TaxID=182062 RepID=A0A8H5GGS6_9AGAR|nr:hypothetical protein D9758_009371 [Tetrapyrgos nigripes]